MKEDLPKGFTCECGKEHRYPGYVYAHFREMLTFTCPECGAMYTIVLGHATRLNKEPTRGK